MGDEALPSVHANKVRCDACPITCYIGLGAAGACDRYANVSGELVRVDPQVLLRRVSESRGPAVPFLKEEWDGTLLSGDDIIVTAIGSGTTYPEYKPAPLIVSSEINGVDMVTVVTEGIFSYCGVKLKIDTDRHLGSEQSTVFAQGEAVGHVTTGEYGSQMISIGGVTHLTGGSKQEGRATCDAILALCNSEPVELSVDGGATVVAQAGRPPIVDGHRETKMRVGCGSAAIGMFAKQWYDLVDDVVVIDDHITGVMSEHQAGKVLGVRETGIKIKGRRSTPGRYFQVAMPGTGWGGTSLQDPFEILGPFNAKHAWPGMRVLMVSTTGEHFKYFELNEALAPVERELPSELNAPINRVYENCEPAGCSVLFVAGAGGSLRSGIVENPIAITNAIKDGSATLSCAGKRVFMWPGGGITFMVDVEGMPKRSFGYVPTPAIVAPIEFSLSLSDYEKIGGHSGSVQPLAKVLGNLY